VGFTLLIFLLLVAVEVAAVTTVAGAVLEDFLQEQLRL
jgi:hypothetical protein